MGSDQSPYTYEFRIIAATKWHESSQDKGAMKQIRQYLAKRFDIDGEIPVGRVIKQWHNKLFTTGTLHDEDRSGRQKQENNSALIKTSVLESPTMSL